MGTNKVDHKKFAKSLKKYIADAFNTTNTLLLDWSGTPSIKTTLERTKGIITVELTPASTHINSGIISKLANEAIDLINKAKLPDTIWGDFIKVEPSYPEEKKLKIELLYNTRDRITWR